VTASLQKASAAPEGASRHAFDSLEIVLHVALAWGKISHQESELPVLLTNGRPALVVLCSPENAVFYWQRPGRLTQVATCTACRPELLESVTTF
jgi:hypothetical protein